jgi:class 3 adenylate cyclase/tetratricopeptide (TPR) repeat protein
MEALSTYIPMDRRQALARGETLPDRALGSALFADISGFTQLAEALVRTLGARRAAEELICCLNEVYEALITEVHRRHGSVVGFSGDAITCWFDGDDGLRAVASGFAMQAALQRSGRIAVPSGETVEIAAKVAIAVGPVRRFVVGSPDVVRVDVLAGETLQRMAAGEHLAARGEVLIDQALDAQVQSALRIAEWRTDDDTGRCYAVISDLLQPVSDDPWPPIESEAIQEEEASSWVLRPVHDRLRTGQEAFLAELRPTVAFFMGFGGIDYDRDSDAPQRLDAYVRWVQQILVRYGGQLIQITIGDKASYLYASFGALVAHDDDARRAVAAALEALSLPAELDYIGDVRIGVTLGRTYCGAYGSSSCRTYGVQGDSVNLSARLMQAAPSGGVLTDDGVYRAAEHSFLWEQRPPLRVKNKSEPVAVFRPLATRSQPVAGLQEPLYTVPFVGREAELTAINDTIGRTFAGEGRIIAFVAEAGMGKSRLVAETIQLWRTGSPHSRGHGIDVHAGECESYAASNSYHVWHGILRSFFGLDETAADEEQIAALEDQLRAINPALVPRLPLLGLALNLSIPENDLTRSLDAKLRKGSLEALLVDCLRARAAEGPLLVVLEDCHWLDPLSRDLLEAVARGVATLPVLLVVAYRPPQPGQVPALQIAQLPQCRVLELTSLTPLETERLIELKLSELAGPGSRPSEKLVQRVAGLAQGNPFFIEELLHYLHDRNLDPRDDEALANLDLPASLDRLILSRIDQLSETQKITIKVASVIGRQFRMDWLWGAHPQIGAREQIKSDLDALHRLDLTPLDQQLETGTPAEPERVYLFKHIVTRDVAYESVPYGTRSQLHGQLGQFIERAYAEELDRYVDLLAYHYDLSQIEPKKREYLFKAGEAAQTAFANETAIAYYRRLLPLLPEAEQVNVLIRLGQVLELVGEWSEAADLYRQALELADRAGDQRAEAACRRTMGWLLRKQGAYQEAIDWLVQARAGFEGLDDRAAVSQVMTDIGEIKRQLGEYAEARQWYEDALRLTDSVEEPRPRLMARAQALKGAGTLAAQQGDNETARTLYQESLAIQRDLGDRPGVAVLLSNLGVVAYYSGDYASARSLDEESLAVFREIGDHWSVATLLNNIGDIARDQGDFAAGKRLLAESLDVRRQLGDMGGIAFSLNSLGDVLLDEGDLAAARPLLEESLVINHDLGDRAAVAYLLDDFAAILAAGGQPELALRLAGAAAAAREAIGSQLSPGERSRFDRLEAPAWQGLDEDRARAVHAEGRALAVDRAVELALQAPVGARSSGGLRMPAT